MDFYYAMSNYHILCCLLHKMCINKNKGVLYISSYVRYNQPNIVENILKSGIFEEVYFYEELEYTKTKKIMTQSMLMEEMNRLCKKVEASIGTIIKKSNDFFICSDFYSIGLYLITNKIKYNYFEDGCGTISKPYLPFRIIEKENPNRAAIVKQIKALGENEYVVNRFAALNNQEKGYHNDKDIDFDVEKMLKKLNDKQIKKLLDIYEVKKIKMNYKETDLLLTMHYNEIMSYESQKQIYGLLLDYFTNDNEQIVIKPHPADSIRNYEKLFPGVKEVNRYMPAELFPYCINKNFKNGITCWSTAVYNLRKIIKNIISFDIRIDTTYKDFDKYYAIIMYLKKMKNEKRMNLKFININDIQFKLLLKKHFPAYNKYFSIEDESNSTDTIYIVDEIDRIENNKIISIRNSINPDNSLVIRKKYGRITNTEIVGLYNLEEINLNIDYLHKYSKYIMNITMINRNQYFGALSNFLEKENKITIDEFQKEIRKKENEIEELKNISYLKTKEIEKLQNSTSWKITKPLRLIMDILRNIR